MTRMLSSGGGVSRVLEVRIKGEGERRGNGGKGEK